MLELYSSQKHDSYYARPKRSPISPKLGVQKGACGLLHAIGTFVLARIQENIDCIRFQHIISPRL